MLSVRKGRDMTGHSRIQSGRPLPTIALSFFVVLALAPVLWLVATSFKPADQTVTFHPLFTSSPTLDAYKAALGKHRVHPELHQLSDLLRGRDTGGYRSRAPGSLTPSPAFPFEGRTRSSSASPSPT